MEAIFERLHHKVTTGVQGDFILPLNEVDQEDPQYVAKTLLFHAHRLGLRLLSIEKTDIPKAVFHVRRRAA